MEYAETLRAFCATVPGIEAAYVCAVENVYDGAEPVQALRFCAQLTSPTAPFRRGKRTRCASTPAEPPPGGELAPEDRDDP